MTGNRRRVRPPGGGIPPAVRGRNPGCGDVDAALESLREIAGRTEPIARRLAEVHEEIADRLVAAGGVGELGELVIEVFDEGDEVVAVVNLPGLAEADIAVTVDDRELTIVGFKSSGRLSGTAELPADVRADWVVTTRNGVVEVRFCKRKEAES